MRRVKGAPALCHVAGVFVRPRPSRLFGARLP